jgi:hypothetical protein
MAVEKSKMGSDYLVNMFFQKLSIILLSLHAVVAGVQVQNNLPCMHGI